MSPLSSYTPFESLLFFQSLAAHDPQPASFAAISEHLQANPYIRQDVAFDTSRLTPQALEGLYAALVDEDWRSGDETAAGVQPLGDGDHPPNPRKRKVATPALHDGGSRSSIVPAIVSRLYARYKDRVVNEIRNDEAKYREIKDEITRLENVPEEQPTPGVEAVQPVTTAADRKVDDIASAPASSSLGQTAPASTAAANVVTTQQPRQQVPLAAASPSAGQPPPASVPKSTQGVAAPSIPVGQGAVSQPTRNGHQQIHANTDQRGRKIQPAPTATRAPDVPIMPYQQAAQIPNPSFSVAASGAPQPSFTPATQHPLNGASSSTVAQQTPTQVPALQGTGDTNLQQQQQFWPAYAKAQSTTYTHPLPPTTAPYPNNQPPSASFPPPPSTPSSAATNQNQQQVIQPARPESTTAVQPTTPISLAVGGPGKSSHETASFSESRARRLPVSRTPWKMPVPITIPQRDTTPEPPRPEDISPISEHAPSPAQQEAPSRRRRRKSRDDTAKAQRDAAPAASTRNRKPTPALRDKASATQVPSSAPPSTRSRSRGFSVTSRDEEFATDTTAQSKIKKEVPSTPAGFSDDATTTRSGVKRKRPPSSHVAQEEEQSVAGHASQYVTCTRNFSRTCGPIMNDVAAHKYASIFAKPLTERDAPGYRSLIHRPQDIKSIKSAIYQGSKAVAAASEAGDVEVPSTPAAGSGLPPSKNTGFLLKKSADLVPPKAIVQSSQLETEVIRMFANAVMFNPTPEQTFGPAFPMKSDSRSREGTEGSDPDEEGGIIKDTLEMYDDIEKALSTWRAAERAVDDRGSRASMQSFRRDSASDINMDGTDAGKKA